MKEQIINNLEYIALFIGILLLTIIVASLLNRFFKRLIRRSTAIMNNDPTNYKFLRHAINALVYIVGFSIAIYVMPSLRVLAGSLLAGAGVLAVAVGFASQQALSNIISGVFIVIFKPFRINDRLLIRDKYGVVEDITLRHTVIRDLENKRIIIPNSLVSDEIIINSDITDEKICKRIEIGISYDSNIDLAKKIFQEEILNNPRLIDGRTAEQIEKGEDIVPVRVISLGDSSVNIRAWTWAIDTSEAFKMSCEVMEAVKKRFDNEGIEIPFPHRTIVQKELSIQHRMKSNNHD